jgi:hypothetical protein
VLLRLIHPASNREEQKAERSKCSQHRFSGLTPLICAVVDSYHFRPRFQSVPVFGYYGINIYENFIGFLANTYVGSDNHSRQFNGKLIFMANRKSPASAKKRAPISRSKPAVAAPTGVSPHPANAPVFAEPQPMPDPSQFRRSLVAQ